MGSLAMAPANRSRRTTLEHKNNNYLLARTHGIPPDCRAWRRPFTLYVSPHTRSGQSRVYRVTQLRTDDVVQYRKSTGTGPVILIKVVPAITSAAFGGHHGPTNVRSLLFSSLHFFNNNNAEEIKYFVKQRENQLSTVGYYKAYST